MPGDYSRQTYQPANGFTQVLKQQGRVGLDWEHNELMEIQDRRSRVQMMDLVTGDALVPDPGSASFKSPRRCVVPAITPSGFKITFDGPGSTLSIGPGRADGEG